MFLQHEPASAMIPSPTPTPPSSPATSCDPRDIRLGRTMAVLEGLATGDALGEACGYNFYASRERLTAPLPALGELRYTDDTEMASAIVEVLARVGGIDEEILAWQFRRRYRVDPERGYGKMTRRLLERTLAGEDWRTVAATAFGGGSFGNGSAMRAAPVGAWYAGEEAQVVKAATASAIVTHTHPEGIAGAVAVALAASAAHSTRHLPPAEASTAIFEIVLRLTPSGRTADGIRMASTLPDDTPLRDAVKLLGNGIEVSCMDTVPFCLWTACRCLEDFREGVILSIEAGGDCDTCAAITASIIAARLGQQGIPQDWIAQREALRLDGVSQGAS